MSKEAIFEVAHEEVGVRWCHRCAHCCSLQLDVVLTIELEIVKCKDKFYESDDVRRRRVFVLAGVEGSRAGC